MSLNLDAILGETSRDPLTYKQQTFPLPAELPGSVIAPFLSETLGLPALIAEFIDAESASDDDTDGEGWFAALIDTLLKRPSLPKELLDAAKAALTELLEAGEEGQAERFFALRPSVNAYAAIATNLPGEYGFDLTGFFSSSESSETDGTDSKQTSPGSTPDSTPEGSGDTPQTPGSSASDDSGS